mmetsp:Transcript_70/g.144  ORF Transcript_70/g.144 Transcript_70/m.144 type:complete len:83 (-) Transcript_70:67-315(-)
MVLLKFELDHKERMQNNYQAAQSFCEILPLVDTRHLPTVFCAQKKNEDTNTANIRKHQHKITSLSNISWRTYLRSIAANFAW